VEKPLKTEKNLNKNNGKNKLKLKIKKLN
jgi:hypothetical protein